MLGQMLSKNLSINNVFKLQKTMKRPIKSISKTYFKKCLKILYKQR